MKRYQMNPMNKAFKTIFLPLNLSLKKIEAAAMHRDCEPRRNVAIYLQLLLFIVLVLPMGCACFPDQSKEIDKEREWDKKSKKLNIAYWSGVRNYKKELSKVKDRIKNLNQPPVDMAKGQQLKTECKNFLQQSYLPYLLAWQSYEVHLAKHERDRSAKAKGEEMSRKIAGHILYIKENLLNESDAFKLCEFILELKEPK